jgi:hypothetical protein
MSAEFNNRVSDAKTSRKMWLPSAPRKPSNESSPNCEMGRIGVKTNS